MITLIKKSQTTHIITVGCSISANKESKSCAGDSENGSTDFTIPNLTMLLHEFEVIILYMRYIETEHFVTIGISG